MRVYTRHVRQAGLCGPGVRAWLVNRGYSRQQMREVMRNGMCVEEAKQHNDPLMNRVIDAAYAEAAREDARG